MPGIVARRQFTEGALVRADAGVAQAQAQLQRNQPLAEARAISAQEWLQTQTTLKLAQAEAATARAALQTARINLDYTAIKAPIAGRIGRALVTEGALVGQGDATQLAVIQQTHPLYVNFSQSAADALRLRRAFDSGQLKRSAGGAAEIRVVLDDGSDCPLPGKLLFADQTLTSREQRLKLVQLRESAGTSSLQDLQAQLTGLPVSGRWADRQRLTD